VTANPVPAPVPTLAERLAARNQTWEYELLNAILDALGGHVNDADYSKAITAIQQWAMTPEPRAGEDGK
jgi:hypothetical protein